LNAKAALGFAYFAVQLQINEKLKR